MRFISILQARTNSARLPKKSLLPIAGVPLSLLCAKRCFSKDLEFILATSDNKTDDDLVRLFKSNNFMVYRGQLNNVLDRFIKIINIKKLYDSDVIIRLTADNPLVDIYLIKKMITIIKKVRLVIIKNSVLC